MTEEELSSRQLPDVNVVNIGGPLDNIITSRSQRPDFVHVDLSHGPNTIVANVNSVDLKTILGSDIRFLRVSNVPFIPVPTGSYIAPDSFIRQAQNLKVKRIVITTGIFSEDPISVALNKAGFSVQKRVIHQRPFITARC